MQFSSESSEADTNSRRTTLSRGLPALALDLQATPPAHRQRPRSAGLERAERHKTGHYEIMSPVLQQPAALQQTLGSQAFLMQGGPRQLSGSNSLPKTARAPASTADDALLPYSSQSLLQEMAGLPQRKSPAGFSPILLSQGMSRSLPAIASITVGDSGHVHEYEKPTSLLMTSTNVAGR